MTSVFHDGLACGIHEAVKALKKAQAYHCVLASNCDKTMYVKLVGVLCAENKTNLIKVDDKKRVKVGYSCVMVRDDSKESQAKDSKVYFKCKK